MQRLKEWGCYTEGWRVACLWLLATSFSACGGRAETRYELPSPSPSPSPQGGSTSDIPIEPQFDELRVEYACGLRTAEIDERSEFLSSGERCAGPRILNTFALRLKGAMAPHYSAVVKCGYIRYDNGTFVGERIEVEAHDGEWCDRSALERIEIVDRMLLTDVAFAIEARAAATAERRLAVQFTMLTSMPKPVASETSLCLYVAHREPGNISCRAVSPVPYCVCPDDDAWQDFITAAEISLLKP